MYGHLLPAASLTCTPDSPLTPNNIEVPRKVGALAFGIRVGSGQLFGRKDGKVLTLCTVLNVARLSAEGKDHPIGWICSSRHHGVLQRSRRSAS